MAPVKGGSKKKFSENQDVLARWNDGLFYLGTILNVSTCVTVVLKGADPGWGGPGGQDSLSHVF